MAAEKIIWISIDDALPSIPENCWRGDRLTLARSMKHGVLALWYTRGRIDEYGRGIYSGSGEQRLWMNNDRMQCEDEFIDDIVEWAEMPV